MTLHLLGLAPAETCIGCPLEDHGHDWEIVVELQRSPTEVWALPRVDGVDGLTCDEDAIEFAVRRWRADYSEILDTAFPRAIQIQEDHVVVAMKVERPSTAQGVPMGAAPRVTVHPRMVTDGATLAYVSKGRVEFTGFDTLTRAVAHAIFEKKA